MIEAGTYMIAGAITKGRVRVTNIVPKHMDAITSKLLEAGVPIEIGDSYITVNPTENLKSVPLKANPYPGFPTDMQPQFSVLMTVAQGVSTISDGIYSTRFKYKDHLTNMGANITYDEKEAKLQIIDLFLLLKPSCDPTPLPNGHLYVVRLQIYLLYQRMESH